MPAPATVIGALIVNAPALMSPSVLLPLSVIAPATVSGPLALIARPLFSVNALSSVKLAPVALIREPSVPISASALALLPAAAVSRVSSPEPMAAE